ncbi:hypothetical protein VOLCADRAFT_89402 [Volvox carteri f. nagariensis]|uniref:Ion transport domain-containing protein n=1 Tax=Volvox carteri f. nagariensis TaxID=3068 RepID=D8TRL5_VOLCA|nr:uncharacterized protein VOLCADRAFT_89402 [Volvox carteri f. nagariensis]EFJ49913.1 hypothetical protein VOLCADRAFT_89402 [Volvox carteri f. nagariensis]|eukprot:XP_002948978.1 hypothetical protein VOLCADRAFT_89402 [Volvox carteri f. nagariensis]
MADPPTIASVPYPKKKGENVNDLYFSNAREPGTLLTVDPPPLLPPARPSPAGQRKNQLLASPGDAAKPPPLEGLKGSLAEPASPLHPVAQLVDIVLQLTKERYGASLRVQRKVVDEVVQGVAEAADESERGESMTLSHAGTARLSVLEPITAMDATPRAIGSPKFAEEVENVYKFDLMEDNPKWKSFLTSSTVDKARVWQSKRQMTSSPLSRLICSAREWIYMTLSYPDYSDLAYWFGVFMICIILLNTITFCIESVPYYANTSVYSALTIVDYICMGIFTVEYLLRLLCCPNLGRFVRSFSNFIDLVAILPFYAELCAKGTSNESEAFQTRVVRLLRVFRVLRIVKTMPKLRHLTLVSDTLRDSVEVLIMLACLLLVLLVVFGTIIFFVEPGTFDSIPQAMYYAQTTLTTTGYGDLYPVTPWGRFLAGAAMLLCMVVISLPIAVIGGNFSEKWSDYKQFKGAIDRSSRVYPTARSLQGELERYEKALDDVMKRLQECEVASEKRLQTVREDIGVARMALLRGGAAGTGAAGSPPSAEDAAGRLFQAAKAVIRRGRNGGSTTTIALSGSYSSIPPMPTPLSPGASAAVLVDLGNDAACSGSPPWLKRQDEQARAAAPLTAGCTSQHQQPEGEGGIKALAAAGKPGCGEAAAAEAAATLGRDGVGFKAMVSRVMRDRKGRTKAEAHSSVSEPGMEPGGSGRAGSVAGTAGPASAGGCAPHPPLSSIERGDHAMVAAAAEASSGSTTARMATGPAVNASGGNSSRKSPVGLAAVTPSSPEHSAGFVEPLLGPTTEDICLPSPPQPPVPPPPAPPPPPIVVTPQHSVATTASLSASVNAPTTASARLGGLARHVTSSVTNFLGRKNNGALVSTASVVNVEQQEVVAGAAAVQLPMDPAALETAAARLEHAEAGCRRARDLRIRHEALAAQAAILRTDGMPDKLETASWEGERERNLDEQYRLLRCWQDELGPMAERMWCLRDALDELAWALQEGLQEEDKIKYQPASREERASADAALGVVRYKMAGPEAAKAAAAGSRGGSASVRAGAGPPTAVIAADGSSAAQVNRDMSPLK